MGWQTILMQLIYDLIFYDFALIIRYYERTQHECTSNFKKMLHSFCSIHCTENDLIGKLKLQFFLYLSKRYCFDQYQKIFAPNNTYTIISNSVYFVPFTCCQNRKHIWCLLSLPTSSLNYVHVDFVHWN